MELVNDYKKDGICDALQLETATRLHQKVFELILRVQHFSPMGPNLWYTFEFWTFDKGKQNGLNSPFDLRRSIDRYRRSLARGPGRAFHRSPSSFSAFRLTGSCRPNFTNRHRYSFIIGLLPRYRAARNGDAVQRRECCPSVCLSVKRVQFHCDKAEEKSVQTFIPCKGSFFSFLRKRMVGGGNTFCLKFWVNRPALERNRRFWNDNRS